MPVHLKKHGWHKTACGLSGQRKSTEKDTQVSCNNCRRFAATATLTAAWATVRPVRKTYYIRRAGFSVEQGLKLLKAKPVNWTIREQNLIKRQLASNPVHARQLNQPVRAISRGGSGDNMSRYAPEWSEYQWRKLGKCCPHCGGTV